MFWGPFCPPPQLPFWWFPLPFPSQVRSTFFALPLISFCGFFCPLLRLFLSSWSALTCYCFLPFLASVCFFLAPFVPLCFFSLTVRPPFVLPVLPGPLASCILRCAFVTALWRWHLLLPHSRILLPPLHLVLDGCPCAARLFLALGSARGVIFAYPSLVHISQFPLILSSLFLLSSSSRHVALAFLGCFFRAAFYASRLGFFLRL